MDIRDNSWSLEEMNYTLSLVVAVPELEVIPCLRVLLSVMDNWATVCTCVEIL